MTRGAAAGRFAALVLLLVWHGGTVAAPKPELKEVQNRIEALQKELDSKEDAKAGAADALKTSEQAISKINRALRELSQRQEEAGSRLSGLEREKARLRQRIAEEQNLLGKLLYQQYLSGQRDHFRILLDQENPGEALRQLRYYVYLTRARTEFLEGLRLNLNRLQDVIGAAAAKQRELARIRSDQDQQKQQLVVQQEARKKLVARLEQQIGKQRRELSQLQRDEKRLTQLIERLAKLQQPRKRAAPTPLRNNSVPDTSQAGAAFQQLKGKLHLPVQGELAGRFGSPRKDSGALWRGLFIRTAPAQEVHTVASGQVVFADWLRGFGNLIIVDHGGGYMSLYGNNEALFKQVGDRVRAGEVIASTGNSGGNPETGLYFELRYQSKPFDPLTWCRVG